MVSIIVNFTVASVQKNGSDLIVPFQSDSPLKTITWIHMKDSLPVFSPISTKSVINWYQRYGQCYITVNTLLL